MIRLVGWMTPSSPAPRPLQNLHRRFSKIPVLMVTSSRSMDHFGRVHGACAMPLEPVPTPHDGPKHDDKMEGSTMLPDLLVPLSDDSQPYNLLRNITFRLGGASITPLLISLIVGPALIPWLKTHQTAAQLIRDDGPQSHLLTKTRTPPMGGLLILISFSISTLFRIPQSNPQLWPVLLNALNSGDIGPLDDCITLRKRSHNGMSARMKMLLHLGIACCTSRPCIELSPEQLR